MRRNNNSKITLDQWVVDILANPISKCPASLQEFMHSGGIVDARVLLKNTRGFSEWDTGQSVYEKWESGGQGYASQVISYKAEIAYDRPIYEHFRMDGVVLDVGGGSCTVREFLPLETNIISVDPYLSCMQEVPKAKMEAYSCLARPLNFIGAMAEFLPFIHSQFNWVHMRSMLDHVQIADLAILEAHRVLKKGGNLLIGLYVEGGKTGNLSSKEKLKHLIKDGLTLIGFNKWKDHHIWHPTYSNLTKLIEDNGFVIQDVYWQPYWNDQVCYVHAKKRV